MTEKVKLWILGFITFADIIMGMKSKLYIPLLFIFSVVTFVGARAFSCSNDRCCHEIFLAGHTPGAFPHNHCNHPEISHEDFFHHTYPSDLFEIPGCPEEIHHDFIAMPLKIANAFWHPPKLSWF